jgi:hypothetical protein
VSVGGAKAVVEWGEGENTYYFGYDVMMFGSWFGLVASKRQIHSETA